MKEYTFDRSVETRTSVIPPHFDDERTVLSARQVVPLEKINARVRHRRQWFLGGAFAIAMVLGAASALLASYLKLRNVSDPGSEVSQNVKLTPAPLVTEDTVTSEPPIVASFAEPTVTTVTPKKETTPKRRTLPTSEPDFIHPRTSPRVNEEEELERIRDAVLFDEWQERRARRAIRRERRRADRYDRDLSNLDEIFEGPRRP
jgi:hypothetical protein